jgi:hypothetical protein
MTDYYTAGASGGRAVFFRFSLASGGQVQLSGSIENTQTTYNAALGATLYNADQTAATFFGSVGASPGSTSTFSWPAFQNQTGTPKDYILRFTTDGMAGIFDAEVELDVSGLYVPNASCEPPLTDTQWTGSRSVYLPPVGAGQSFNTADRAEAVQAIKRWNEVLAELQIDVQFVITTTVTGADILVFNSGAIQDTGGWSPSSPGVGTVLFPSNQSGLGRGNLVEHIILHEFGHVLELGHVHPSQTPWNQVNPPCTGRDTIMFWHVDQVLGPFPGITAPDKAALVP